VWSVRVPVTNTLHMGITNTFHMGITHTFHMEITNTFHMEITNTFHMGITHSLQMGITNTFYISSMCCITSKLHMGITGTFYMGITHYISTYGNYDMFTCYKMLYPCASAKHSSRHKKKPTHARNCLLYYPCSNAISYADCLAPPGYVGPAHSRSCTVALRTVQVSVHYSTVQRKHVVACALP
jgi:hypothetical protein